MGRAEASTAPPSIALAASPNQAFDILSVSLDRYAAAGTMDATFEIGR